MSRELRRLFVGVPLPAALEPTVTAVQESLQIPGLKLVRRGQMHVTIAFLGEVGCEASATATRVVSERDGSMGGVALLGGIVLLPAARRARVVALAIDDAEGVLGTLSTEITGELVEAGAMVAERRPFRPHLTIARLRKPGNVHQKYDSRSERFAIRSVCLYRSTLTHEGAEYEVLTEAILRDRSHTGI